MKSRAWRVLAGSLVALGLAGCGDSDGGGSDEASGAGAASGASGSGSGGVSGSSTGGSTATPGAGLGTAGAPSSKPPCPMFSKEPGALADIGFVHLLEVDIFGVRIVGEAGGYVYFIDGELARVPVSGGPVELLGPPPSQSMRLYGEDLLLWTEEDEMTGSERIVTAPLSDPMNATVVVDSTPPAEDLQVSDEHIYWATRTPVNVHRAPLGGGASEVFVPGAEPLGSLLHGGYYWFMDFVSSTLDRVPIAGGMRERLTEVHFGGPMAGDENGVYWGDTSLKTIEKWTPEDGRKRLSGADPNAVLVHEGTIYWGDGFNDGSVRSIRTDGTEPKTLLCGLFSPGPLFIEGGYLVIASDEGIMRINR
jgi:hypothetical protein